MRTNQGSSEKRKPVRTCLGCRKTAGKYELVRVVRTPEGSVVVDPTGKRNGRGAYVCRNPQCLARVLKTGALARSLKVTLPPETGESLMKEICHDS